MSDLSPKHPLHPSQTILVDLTVVTDELSYEYESPQWLENGKMHIYLKRAGRTEVGHRILPVCPNEHYKSGANKPFKIASFPQTQNHPRTATNLQNPDHKMYPCLLLFATVISLAKAITYCDGPQGPKQDANCNYWETETCCVNQNQQADCKWGFTGSHWSVTNCDSGYQCEEQVNQQTYCSKPSRLGSRRFSRVV